MMRQRAAGAEGGHRDWRATGRGALALTLTLLLSSACSGTRVIHDDTAQGAPHASEGGAPVNGEGESAGAGGSPPDGVPDIEFCTPGARVCEGSQVRVCNEAGNGSVAAESCASNETCLDGSCAPQECTPSTTFCSGKQIRVCASSGLSSKVLETCQADEYCEPQAGVCKVGVCSPDQPACDGNAATHCNPEGSGYSGESEPCSAHQSCEAGVCVDQVCGPGSAFCQGQDVKRCAENGLSSSVEATCADQACVEESGEASCVGQCVPGTKRCKDATAAQTCSTQGVWGAVQSCAAATPECHAAGVCGERINLLTKTEALDAAVWATNRLLAFGAGGSEIDSTSSTAPDGAMTAELLREDATSGTHSIEQVVTLDPTQTYTWSIHIKSSGLSGVMLYLANPADTNSGVALRVNLATGTVHSAYASGSGVLAGSSLEALPNGWYRAVLSGQASSSAGSKLRAIVYTLPSAGGESSHQGGGVAGALLWGAQLEKGQLVTDYRAN
jgi:hypothetical protein